MRYWRFIQKGGIRFIHWHLKSKRVYEIYKIVISKELKLKTSWMYYFGRTVNWKKCISRVQRGVCVKVPKCSSKSRGREIAFDVYGIWLYRTARHASLCASFCTEAEHFSDKGIRCSNQLQLTGLSIVNGSLSKQERRWEFSVVYRTSRARQPHNFKNDFQSLI